MKKGWGKIGLLVLLCFLLGSQMTVSAKTKKTEKLSETYRETAEFNLEFNFEDEEKPTEESSMETPSVTTVKGRLSTSNRKRITAYASARSFSKSAKRISLRMRLQKQTRWGGWRNSSNWFASKTGKYVSLSRTTSVQTGRYRLSMEIKVYGKRGRLLGSKKVYSRIVNVR
ncbi:MAG: hypothetical protein Q4F41_15505 [Eubacteriales bacterium]|nr:hypothetical protein [Eubacteriales bacterium]